MGQKASRLFEVSIVNACGVDYATTVVSPASLAERCHQGPCPLGVFQCPHGRECGSVTADAWAEFFGMDDEWAVLAEMESQKEAEHASRRHAG